METLSKPYGIESPNVKEEKPLGVRIVSITPSFNHNGATKTVKLTNGIKNGTLIITSQWDDVTILEYVKIRQKELNDYINICCK